MFGGISKTTFILVQFMMAILMAGGVIAYDYFAPHPEDAVISQLQEDLAEQKDLADEQGKAITASQLELTTFKRDITDDLDDTIDDAVTKITTIMNKEFDTIDERLDGLEKAATPTAGVVGLSAVMIPNTVIEAAGTYTWNITLTNRTDSIQLVHIRGIFTARSHTSTINYLGTKMIVGAVEAGMERCYPSATNCIYMEIYTNGDVNAVHLTSYQTKVVVVTLTLSYSSGSAIWDWSFSNLGA